MADTYRPYVAELADKRGYIHPIHAKQLAEERTVTMTGDVTGTANWDFGEPASASQASESMALSIGEQKVTTPKLADGSVTTPKVADDAVTLAKIDDNAMNGTVQDNDSKLATHAAVKTYVDAQISGQGTYLGKKTVAEVNAMVTANLHNGDRVQMADAGTINLGPGGVGFDVVAGEDLILYKSGSTVQWDTMDGNFKTKQTPVTDPAADGTTITAIDTVSQNANGEITATKKTIRTGNGSNTGVVKLSDSTSSTSGVAGGVAATPAAVKAAYDLASNKKDKQTAIDTDTSSGSGKGGTTRTLTRLQQDANGVITPTFADIPTASASTKGLMGTAEYTKLSGIAEGAEVNQNAFGNVKVGSATIVADSKTDTLEIAGGTGIDAVGDTTNDKVTLSLDSATQASLGKADSAVQDVTVDGASVVNSSTKVAAVPNASTSAKGVVQLAGSIGATVASENNKAATEKAVRDAINDLDSTATSTDGTNVQVKVTEADGKVSAVNVTTDNTENKNNKVSSWQTTPDNTHYPSEKLVKDALNAKADANSHVSIADSIISRTGQSGNGWYKIAERQFNSLSDNINVIYDVFASTTEIKLAGELSFRIRSGSSSGGNIVVKNYKLFSDDWTSDFKFKLVSRGLAGSCIIELWASCLTSYSGLAIAERNSSSYSSARRKGDWTYSNYINNGGSSAPVNDATNNVVVTDVEIVYRQHAIASPTNDNLVAMDANGLVKDSGLTKSSVESAITSAGSAIQGVKVNNTTLTPDANKVVTVPLATTSADGAMSAADKTKLNNSTTYTQSSGTAPVKVDAYGALTPVPMDSTPTASSTNLMTSGDIKTAIDSVANNVYPWYQIGGGSSPAIKKVCNISNLSTANYNGFLFLFDYVTEYNYTLGRSCTGTFELQVLCAGSSEPSYKILVKSDSGLKDALLVPNISLYVNWSGGKLNAVLASTVGSSKYNGMSVRIRGCKKYDGSDVSSYVTMATNTTYTPETGYSEKTDVVTTLYSTYTEGTVVGSTSVPVYADADGKLTPCTDDFARDSEVVTNVEYVAAQSGGGGNLNKTKNGSTTSVLAFMTAAEATSLWQSAWAAAN